MTSRGRPSKGSTSVKRKASHYDTHNANATWAPLSLRYALGPLPRQNWSGAGPVGCGLLALVLAGLWRGLEIFLLM